MQNILLIEKPHISFFVTRASDYRVGGWGHRGGVGWQTAHRLCTVLFHSHYEYDFTLSWIILVQKFCYIKFSRLTVLWKSTQLNLFPNFPTLKQPLVYSIMF